MTFPLEEYSESVWCFALRLTGGDVHQAEDLTQEVLLRAWRNRWRLRDPRRARVWLFRITANFWRDQARRMSRRPACTADAVDHQGTNVAADQALIDQEDIRRAFNAMNALPARQREVLHLHARESLSLAEIASVLGISTDAVKASLWLARKTMRRKLEDICSDRFPVE